MSRAVYLGEPTRGSLKSLRKTLSLRSRLPVAAQAVQLPPPL